MSSRNILLDVQQEQKIWRNLSGSTGSLLFHKLGNFKQKEFFHTIFYFVTLGLSGLDSKEILIFSKEILWGTRGASTCITKLNSRTYNRNPMSRRQSWTSNSTSNWRQIGLWPSLKHHLIRNRKNDNNFRSSYMTGSASLDFFFLFKLFSKL